jgi:putative ABC transport system permease protein
MVAFALILMLACANVANMLLARGVARQREIGTRLALGAERLRLIRQLLTEAVVLALPAVALGVFLGYVGIDLGVRTLFATLPPDLAAFVRLVPLHLDARVLAFAMLASVGAAALFGLVPALQSTRLSLVDAIRGNFGAASPSRLRVMLIVSQIAASSLLLTIAGVLVREAARLGHTDTGLRTRDVVSIEHRQETRGAILGALRTSARVDTIAGAAALPLDMRFSTAIVRTEDSRVAVLYNQVSAAYFSVLGIPITAGRSFTRREDANASPVVVVSDAAARRLWPRATPLGRVVRFETEHGVADPISKYQGAVVIGVARDIVVNSVQAGNDQPVLYLPQSPEAMACCLLARVRGQPLATKRAIDEELERAVPGAVERVDLLDTFVVGAVYPYRVAYWVALGLGSLALGLTGIGVYGVVGYLVNQRVREIGVRIALGAQPMDVLALIVSQSRKQAGVAAAAGSLLALVALRVLGANLAGMTAFDAPAFVGAFVVVVSACLLAAMIPSRRAATLDPTITLRQD